MMIRTRLLAGILAFGVLTSAGGMRIGGAAAIVQASSKLEDLRGVEELKALFNKDAGRVRLVLLVSPT
jgi:hypothetical protein